MKRNILKNWEFIRTVIVTGVAIPFMMALSTYAQTTAPATPQAGQGAAGAPTQEAERVIVTGSNIPTAEEVGPNPVLNLNRDLIQKSGERNLEQLLKDQPVANSNSIPVGNNGTGQGGPTGATSVSLRGFDVSATLVLIDGRRVAPFPASGFIDLNTIPLAATESIEILKDGASATYGADAVAGVVNIKLYKDFRGAQTTVEYGNTFDKDAAQFQADVLFGVGDDNTSVSGDIFYYRHNSSFNIDRGNSDKPPFVSSNASPYNLQISRQSAIDAGIDPAILPVNADGTPRPIIFTTAPSFTNGLSPATDYTYSRGRARAPRSIFGGFNFNAFSSSFPEQERFGGYVAFNHKVCGDQLQIYGDFYYADVKQHDELAPGATNDFQTKGQGTLVIPPNHPFALDANGVQITPPNTPTAAEVGLPVGAFNPFNPFQQIISGGTRARLADFGNRLVDTENQAFLSTVGVKGDKLFDGTWGYDAAFRYSQILNIARITDVNVLRYNQINNANDSIFNPTSSNYIGTTIPYNPFGDYRNPIPSNAIPINYATMFRRDLNYSRLGTVDANMYTTDLFHLPGGGVGFAFGAGFRNESLRAEPDDQGRLKQEAGVGQSPVVGAGRKDYDFYGELLVPITSPEMNIPGLHSLEFTYSGRYEAFENNDTNVLVPKVGMRYQPFDDQLTIRSTWGEGFLEPNLFQLYGGAAFILAPTSLNGLIPGGTAEPETTEEVDSNKNLQPEDSRTWTGGIVYTPKWIPAGTLTLSIDLWDIERSGVVVVPGAQEVVRRVLSGHPLPGEEAIIDTNSGTVTFLKTTYANAGRENARGVDLGLQYQLQTPYGTFTSLTQATYLDSFIFQPSSVARAREVSGTTNTQPFEGAFFGAVTGGDGWVKWKGIQRVLWSWNNFEVSWALHYFDGFHEKRVGPAITLAGQGVATLDEHWVEQTYFQDAQASYDLVFTAPVESQPVAGYSKDAKEVVRGKDGKAVEAGQTANYSMPCWKNILNNTKITVGVNNIFSSDPPKQFGIASGNSTGYPGFQYDNLGRFLYVELKKKF